MINGLVNLMQKNANHQILIYGISFKPIWHYEKKNPNEMS